MAKHQMLLRLLAAAVIVMGVCAGGSAQQDEFTNWPEGASPQAVGNRVAENFIVRPYRAQSDPTKAHIGIIYPEVCTWYGALSVAKLNDLNYYLNRPRKLGDLHGQAPVLWSAAALLR